MCFSETRSIFASSRLVTTNGRSTDGPSVLQAMLSLTPPVLMAGAVGWVSIFIGAIWFASHRFHTVQSLQVSEFPATHSGKNRDLKHCLKGKWPTLTSGATAVLGG